MNTDNKRLISSSLHQLPYTLALLTPSDVCIPHREDGAFDRYCRAVQEGNWWDDLVVQIKKIGINPVPILINQSNKIVGDSSLLIFAACLKTEISHILCWQVDNESVQVFSEFLDNFGD